MDFIQLTKVAEDQQIIYARAICEEPDRANQVADYAASKAAFQKWAQETQTASMGKSMGNIRVMHKPDVAGRVIDIVYDDVNKAIDVAIQVDRPDVWKMCKVGAYTGLSVGGSYGLKWPDPMYPGMERYVPKLSELSIVDRPCVPSATFQLLKADGNIEERHFANVSFDADIIGTLKAMVIEHNETMTNAWAKAKLGDLKKVYKRGTQECLAKDDNSNPMSSGIERVQGFLSALAAETTECLDKDLLAKDHPVILSGGAKLRKNQGYEDPNTTGKKLSAATGAVVAGAGLGYTAHAAGKLASPVLIPAMLTSKKFRHRVNAFDDAVTSAKRGVKTMVRTGSPLAGAKSIKHMYQALREGKVHGRGVVNGLAGLRGAKSVPSLISGLGIGGYTAIHAYRSRRGQQQSNAEIHNAIIGATNNEQMTKSLADGLKLAGKYASENFRPTPVGAKTLEYGAPAIGTLVGAGVGARLGYKGNPYRDKDGRYTSKDKAVIVVGTGATAGAIAGAGLGFAITHRGMKNEYNKALAVVQSHFANALAAKKTFENRDAVFYGDRVPVSDSEKSGTGIPELDAREGHKTKIHQAILNVKKDAVSELDNLDVLNSTEELAAKHNPYKLMIERQLKDDPTIAPDIDRSKIWKNGKITQAGHDILQREAEIAQANHTALKKELQNISEKIRNTTKDSEKLTLTKQREKIEDDLAGFDNAYGVAANVADQRIHADKKIAAAKRTILHTRVKDEWSPVSVGRLYRQSAELYKDPQAFVPIHIRDFRRMHESAIQAHHLELIRQAEKRFKAAGRAGTYGQKVNGKKTGRNQTLGHYDRSERFERVRAFAQDRVNRAQERVHKVEQANKKLLSARLAAGMHRMVSPFSDASKSMYNEATAAGRLAVNAMRPTSKLRDIYANSSRKVRNAIKIALFHNEDKDADGKPLVNGRDAKGNVIPVMKNGILGKYPSIHPVKVGMLTGGAALAYNGFTYRDAKGHLKFAKPKDINVTPHLYMTNNASHFSLTTGNVHTGNKQDRRYIAGIQVRGNGVEFLQPGRTAYGNEYNTPQNQSNPQGGTATIRVDGDAKEAINKWAELTKNNKNLVHTHGEFGVQSRGSNLDKDTNEIANKASQAIVSALDTKINENKQNNKGQVKREDFYNFVRQVIGQSAINISGGGEQYASSLTQAQQGKLILKMLPNSKAIGDERKNNGGDIKKITGLVRQAMVSVMSAGGVPDPLNTYDVNALKGAVYVMGNSNLIEKNEVKNIQNSIEGRYQTKDRPGYKQTVKPQSIDREEYIPSTDPAINDLTNKLHEGYPTYSKNALQAMLVKEHRKQQNYSEQELSDDQHLSNAYHNIHDKLAAML